MEHSKILIVDDDAALLMSLSIRLGREGYEVITGTDAHQGLTLAREQSVDLLILDVRMPAADGFSVQEALREMPGPWPPAIYLTGDKSIRADLMARKLGAFAVIHKPFDADRLLATIKRALLQKQK